MRTYIVNPCAPGGRQPVELITDRAKRYRAQKANRQKGHRCIYCGQPRAGDVEHINGKEADNAPANLAYACRSCNTAKGALFAALGLGKRTAQFNPAAAGAKNLAQWVMAVASIKKRDPRTGRLRSGDSSKQRLMPVAEAVAMIRATPPDRRSEFARDVWNLRRQHGTASGSAVPF